MPIEVLERMIRIIRIQEAAEKYENYVFHLCDKEPIDWSLWDKVFGKGTTDEDSA